MRNELTLSPVILYSLVWDAPLLYSCLQASAIWQI